VSGIPFIGSHKTDVESVLESFLTSLLTFAPSPLRSLTRAPPKNPEDPLTITFTVMSPESLFFAPDNKHSYNLRSAKHKTSLTPRNLNRARFYTRMAILPILEIPHPVLRQRAKKVRTIDRKVMKLAYDMVDTMLESGGVGLAANQVGELRRIIVLQMPEEEKTRIYFNPEILRTNGSRRIEEGCLSLPGYRGIVNRSVWIKFQGTDHSDTIVKFKAENLLSQALEHEVDHLNGILYTDHLASQRSFSASRI